MNNSQSQQLSQLWTDLSDAESEKLLGGLTLPSLEIFSYNETMQQIQLQNSISIWNEQFTLMSNSIKKFSETLKGGIGNIK